MIRPLRVSELSLDLNEDVARLYEKHQLGKPKEISKPLDTMKNDLDIIFPQPKKKESRKVVDISKIFATKLSTFHVKTTGDKMECLIFGKTITDNGVLFIGDATNRMVKIFSEDNTLLTTFNISEIINDIAVINDFEAVVSMTDKKLHFLDISKLPTVVIRRSLSLEYVVFCLAPCGDNIVVATRQKNLPSLKMIDRNGKEIWGISTGPDNQQIFKKPFAIQITTFNGANAAIVTDCSKKTLTVIDVDNIAVLKVKYFKDKDLRGVAVDDNGDIFVSSRATREILVVSNDLTKSRVILEGQFIGSNPTEILYRRSTAELYVSYLDGQIDRFKLAEAYLFFTLKKM